MLRNQPYTEVLKTLSDYITWDKIPPLLRYGAFCKPAGVRAFSIVMHPSSAIHLKAPDWSLEDDNEMDQIPKNAAVGGENGDDIGIGDVSMAGLEGGLEAAGVVGGDFAQ